MTARIRVGWIKFTKLRNLLQRKRLLLKIKEKNASNLCDVRYNRKLVLGVKGRMRWRGREGIRKH